MYMSWITTININYVYKKSLPFDGWKCVPCEYSHSLISKQVHHSKSVWGNRSLSSCQPSGRFYFQYDCCVPLTCFERLLKHTYEYLWTYLGIIINILKLWWHGSPSSLLYIVEIYSLESISTRIYKYGVCLWSSLRWIVHMKWWTIKPGQEEQLLYLLHNNELCYCVNGTLMSLASALGPFPLRLSGFTFMITG